MNRREFQLIEGTSQKFWAIELDGPAHSVHFGRIGTAGQTSRKEFATEAQAKASHDKLIAEKLKKGYVEGAATTTTTAAAATSAAPIAAEGKPTPKPEREAAPVGTKAAPGPTPVKQGPPSVLSTAHVIELDPDDWLWATWRPHTPRPRPKLPPFDLKKCLERFAMVTRRSDFGRWDWSKARLDPFVTRQEAHFWFVVMMECARRDVSPGMLVDQFRAQSDRYSGEISREDVVKRIRSITTHSLQLITDKSPAFSLLIYLFSPHDWIALARENYGLPSYNLAQLNQIHVNAFRRDLLPYLTEAECQAMRDVIRPDLDTPSVPPNPYTGFPLVYYLAAALGMHDEVYRVLQLIPNGQYGTPDYFDGYHRPQLLVLGLGSPWLVEKEMRRLKLLLKKPDDVRGWIAHTEDSALDMVRDSILAATRKDECKALIDVLTRVKSPKTAAPMLELMLSSKASGVARRWLDEQPGHAIPGLIPVVTERGKLADAALEYLRAQHRKGHEGFIRECLASAPPEAADKVRRQVLERTEVVVPTLDAESTPGWLQSAQNDGKKLKPPGWITPGDLPPIAVGGRKLNDEQSKAVLASLSKSALGAAQPLVAALKAHADRASLDAFAWALFERWQLEGTPPKEKWAMSALGLLGSDDAALKLTPLIRAWPGESQHQRAVFGLECLRAIGTDVALMQLNGIAQKVSFKGLKAKARELMEAIANDRSLSRTELEDRIVPDCDLDERGGRVFDFGPRQFRFALGGDMKPMVRDEAGKLKDDLPKPGAKDDPALAGAAVDDWKRLKKQIREVAKVQAERLEQAMVTGRRWKPGDFDTLLVRHPLLINLVRLILWGQYDETGKLISTFRVTEERDFADVKEATYRLDGQAKVGVVHPLHLTGDQKSAWGEIFGDYEIIPPFPQLGREARRLEPAEENAEEIHRNKGIKVPAITLVGILDKHGWNRGVPQDAGLFYEHSKPFEGANVTAVIQYDGIPIGAMIDWEDQEVQKCFFVPGLYTPEMYPDHKNAIPLGQVEPVVISEVLGTLAAIASKGK